MARKYIKTGQTEDGKFRRLRAFRHNSYSGHARMMRSQAYGIEDSDTSTKEAKEIAAKIADLAYDLIEALKTRVDPPNGN